MIPKPQQRVHLLLIACLLAMLSGCAFWDNSTTFFNTYYNQKKLMNETEEEFGYNDYIKPPKPRVVVPVEKDIVLEKPTGELPRYVSDMTIRPAKLQPVQIKVDSIIIKGSKILATHPKSMYVDGTLYLMAKAYFYRSEWLPAGIKCMELIEQFPDSKFSPDGHLLSSKNYLVQRNVAKAKVMLSRTVDVAWHQDRFDVLSEAFQLQAETSINEEQYEEAERPYRQAIAQCEDDAQKAKWQCDLGLVLFRVGKFQQSAEELAKVRDMSPEPLTDFEAKLYHATALMYLKEFSSAQAILDALSNDRKFDDYLKLGYLSAANLTMLRLSEKYDALKEAETKMDASNVGSVPILVANFERGLELFRKKEYEEARTYFAKAKVTRSPVFDGASTLYTYLNAREEKLLRIKNEEQKLLNPDSSQAHDSISSVIARTAFELGRTHELMGNADSADTWYRIAAERAPVRDTDRAQYLYAIARSVEKDNRVSADSLLQVIFDSYRTTQYGKEAKARLGYTDYVIADSVADIFQSGVRFRAVGEDSMAIRQFTKVSEEFQKSKYAPASLYSIGWIWERRLKNLDSAAYYYNLLLKRYPESEYAADVKYSVIYAYSKRGLADSSQLPWMKPMQQTTPQKTDSSQQQSPSDRHSAPKSDMQPNTLPNGAVPPPPSNVSNPGMNDVMQTQVSDSTINISPALLPKLNPPVDSIVKKPKP